ncbi:MAG: hypothetical protein IKR09_00550, partial [Alphaproteobacteria bacterium]|nr:hypothetical protein [Alphaproteobacteria bacterium]
HDGDEPQLRLFFSETTVKQRLFLFDISEKTTLFLGYTNLPFLAITIFKNPLVFLFFLKPPFSRMLEEKPVNI